MSRSSIKKILEYILPKALASNNLIGSLYVAIRLLERIISWDVFHSIFRKNAASGNQSELLWKSAILIVLKNAILFHKVKVHGMFL